MATNLGSAYLGLYADDKDLKKDLKKAQANIKKSIGKMQKRINSLTFKAVGIAAAAASVAFVVGMRKAVSAASDLEEVTSKFNTVFKGQERIANSWAKNLVKNYAMSTREAKFYLSSMQDLLVPMGMASVEAGKLSNEIVKLSADLGSFNNLDTDKVMEDIQSALVGNYETMKKYGVVLNATVVSQEALNMGLASNKAGLTAAHKAQAAYTLIVKGSSAAIGDMGRTMGGYANQLKKFKSRLEEFYAALGKKLLPELATLLKRMTDWYDANKKLVDQKIDEYVDKLVVVTKKLYDNLALIKIVLGAILGLSILAFLANTINAVGTASKYLWNLGKIILPTILVSGAAIVVWIKKGIALTQRVEHFVKMVKDITLAMKSSPQIAKMYLYSLKSMYPVFTRLIILAVKLRQALILALPLALGYGFGKILLSIGEKIREIKNDTPLEIMTEDAVKALKDSNEELRETNNLLERNRKLMAPIGGIETRGEYEIKPVDFAVKEETKAILAMKKELNDKLSAMNLEYANESIKEIERVKNLKLRILDDEYWKREQLLDAANLTAKQEEENRTLLASTHAAERGQIEKEAAEKTIAIIEDTTAKMEEGEKKRREAIEKTATLRKKLLKGLTHEYEGEMSPVNKVTQLDKLTDLFVGGETFKGQVDDAGKIIMESGTNMSKAIIGAGNTFGMTTFASGLNIATMWAKVIIGIAGIIEDIVNLPRKVVEAITSMFTTIGNFGKLLTEALDDLIDSVFDMIVGLGDIFTKLIPKLILLVPALIKAALDAIPVLIDAVIDSIPLIVDAMVKAFAQVTLGKDLATSLGKAGLSFLGAITGFDFALKGLKSVFGGGRKYKYLGGAMDVGYGEGGVPTADMTKSYARRVGSGAQIETEQAMMDVATGVLSGYQELVESMGEGVSDTFYANVKDMSVSVYAKATRSAALTRRFGIGLERMAEEIQKQLDIYLGEAIRQYGQDVVTAARDIGFLKPGADILAQAGTLQYQMMASADMTTEELVELSKALSDLDQAIKDAITTWDDIQQQMDVATGTMSQFTQEMYNINKQFDDWAKQMTDLGATVEVLNKIEKKRKEALIHALTAPFESLLDKVMGQITERTRVDWTMSDYMDAIQNIQHDPGTEEYQNEALSLFNGMLGVGNDIVSSIDNAIKMLQDTLNDLLFTDLAAVQSAESFQNEYTKLLNDMMSADAVTADEAVSNFTDFVSTYLDWMSNYNLSYMDLVDQVSADIRAAMEAIGDLKEPTTPEEEAVDWLSQIAGLLEQMIEEIRSSALPGLSSGGITSGPSIVGESGPEMVIPLYQPQQNNLGSIVDSEAIGEAVARHINDGDIYISIDGQPIRAAVTRGLRGRDTELISAVRRAA